MPLIHGTGKHMRALSILRLKGKGQKFGFSHQIPHYGHMIHIVIYHNDTKAVIEQVFQLIRHFHISAPVGTGMDRDGLFTPEPLHRYVMLSASTEEH